VWLASQVLTLCLGVTRRVGGSSNLGSRSLVRGIATLNETTLDYQEQGVVRR
jgi:hypothetical protein